MSKTDEKMQVIRGVHCRSLLHTIFKNNFRQVYYWVVISVNKVRQNEKFCQLAYPEVQFNYRAQIFKNIVFTFCIASRRKDIYFI